MAHQIRLGVDQDFLITNNTADVALTLEGTLTITEDLIVQGDTTTVNVATITIEDAMMSLATGNATNTVDIGFIGTRNGNNVGFIWDESASRFATVDTADTGTGGAYVSIAGYHDLQIKDFFAVGSTFTGNMNLSGNNISNVNTLTLESTAAAIRLTDTNSGTDTQDHFEIKQDVDYIRINATSNDWTTTVTSVFQITNTGVVSIPAGNLDLGGNQILNVNVLHVEGALGELRFHDTDTGTDNQDHFVITSTLAYLDITATTNAWATPVSLVRFNYAGEVDILAGNLDLNNLNITTVDTQTFNGDGSAITGLDAITLVDSTSTINVNSGAITNAGTIYNEGASLLYFHNTATGTLNADHFSISQATNKLSWSTLSDTWTTPVERMTLDWDGHLVLASGNLTITTGNIVMTAGTVDGRDVSVDGAKLDAATNLNTFSTIVFRDPSGNFSAGTITATLNGNALTASTASGVAANSVALGNDTTGNYVQQATTSGNGLTGTVNSEGGTFTVTSNAVSTNTFSTLVFRDGSGNFSATTITAALSGTATNATNIALVDAAAATSTYVLLATAATGNEAPKTDPGITYNASTNTLALTGAITTREWVAKTAAYNAIDGDMILADTLTTGAFTITLPATPAIGTKIGLTDSESNFATANLTLGRNGSLIEATASDLVLSTDDVTHIYVYTGATRGWVKVN